MVLINLKIQTILFQVLRYTITLVTHTAVLLFPVKVRAFSLNQELRPANRSVYLTFKVSGKLSCVVAGGCSDGFHNILPSPSRQDPDHTTVDIVEMVDVNNGIPSLQNPFKIPVNPK